MELISQMKETPPEPAVDVEPENLISGSRKILESTIVKPTK
jgi:hypothetical protein